MLTETTLDSGFALWMAGHVQWRQLMTLSNRKGSVFPGGSKTRVNKAGEAVRAGSANAEDDIAIDEWRAAHRSVLNTFQALLRNRTRHTDIIVVQRHKRKSTIMGKLKRFPRMQLARMDDVAGCRLIFATNEELASFRTALHAANFKHELKNEVDKYDYIKRPKSTGYRGIHDVYSYNANSVHGIAYKGLLIELQYRTQVQHAWATAVEVVGNITESQPKFQQGDKRYEKTLSYASEIISRAFEGMNSCHPDLSDAEVVERFLACEKEINLLQMLRALDSADSDISAKKNVVLILGENEELEIQAFRNATDALRALFQLERDNPEKDIVLVRGDSSEDVRIAFKNYFTDAREFINLIERGCESLAGHGGDYSRKRLER